MNTKVYFRRQMKVAVEVFYFNCRECGTPLMTEKARKAGTCGGHAKGIDQRKFNDAETARRSRMKTSRRLSEEQRIEALVARVRAGEGDDAEAGHDVVAVDPGRLMKRGHIRCVKVG